MKRLRNLLCSLFVLFAVPLLWPPTLQAQTVMRYQGVYSVTSQYNPNDVVQVSGSFYLTVALCAPGTPVTNPYCFNAIGNGAGGGSTITTVNVNTLAAGAQATATLSGGGTVLTLGIPAGATGATGPPGPAPSGTGAVATHNGSAALATAHDQALPVNCPAASNSPTAYTCSTAPPFTPALGDYIQLKADVANTGAATLSVNGATAYPIRKAGGGSSLLANDLLAGTWIQAKFDGSYWQLEGQLGNDPAAAAAAAQATANAAVQRAGDTMTGPLSMNTSTNGTPDNVQALGQATSAGDANVPLAGATAGGVLYANLAEMYGLGGWAESINGGAYSLLARWSDLASPPSAALCQTTACVVTLAPGSTATTDTNGSQMLFFTSTNTGSSAGIPAGDVCSGVAAFVATGNYNENVWCSDDDPTVSPATGTTNYIWYHSSGHALASPSWATPNGATELTSGGTWKAQIDALGLVESAAATATSSITLSTSYVTVPVNAASAALTITLPGTPTSGTMYFIIKTDSSANVVTVSGGSATLNYLGTIGTSTYSGLTAQGKYVRLVYLGSSLGWYVVGSN